MAHPALAGLSNELDWVDVRILEELSFLSQDNGYSTPSRHYLANIINCTISTVSRHLTKLCRLGYLQRQLRTYRTPDGKIRNRTNLYRVALDAAARIKAFLGSFGRGKSRGSTDDAPTLRVPKTKNNIDLKKDTVSPPQGQNPAHKPPWQLPPVYSPAWNQPVKDWKPAESDPFSTQEHTALSTLIENATNQAKTVLERFLQLGSTPPQIEAQQSEQEQQEQQDIKPDFQRFANLGKGKS